MYLSDPQVSRQFGEYAVWWNELQTSVLDTDPQLLPCGRLHGGPTYFRIGITWTSSPLVLPSDTNQLLLFENQFLKREYAQQLQPTAILLEWLNTTMPTLQTMQAHYRSSKFSLPLSVYDKMTWYLVYGAGDLVGGYQFLDQPHYDEIDFGLQNQDSYGQSFGGTVDSPASWVGWTLMLIRQVFSLPGNPLVFQAPLGLGTLTAFNPDGPPQVAYHVYGSWSLKPPTDGSPPIFYPDEATTWLTYNNPLNFPPHQITLTPWQP